MQNKNLNNNDKEKLAIFLAKKLDIMCKDRKVNLVDLNGVNISDFFEHLITFFELNKINMFEAFGLISASLENIILEIEGSSELSTKDIIEYEQTLLEIYNKPENHEQEISSIKM